MDKKDHPENKRSLTERKPVSKDSSRPVENREDRPERKSAPRGGDYKHREEFRGDYKGQGNDRRSGGGDRNNEDRRSGGGFERREGGDRGGFKGRTDDRRPSGGGFERREGGDRGGFKGRTDDRRPSGGGFERREGGDRGGFKGRTDDRRPSGGGFERREGGDRGGFKGRTDDRRPSGGGFERREGGDRGGFKGRTDDRRPSGGGFERREGGDRGGFKGRTDDRRPSGGGFERREGGDRGGFKGRTDDRRPSGGGFERREGGDRGGFKGRTDDGRPSGGGFERREGGDRGGFKGRTDDRRPSGGGFERREGGDRGGFKGRTDDRRPSGGGFERREGGDRGGYKGGSDDRRPSGGGFERREGGDRGGYKGGSDDRRPSGGGFERREGGDRGGYKGHSDNRNTGGGGFDRRNNDSNTGGDKYPSKERKFDKRNPYTEGEKSTAPTRTKRERIETKETQSRFGYKGSNKEFQKAGDSLKKGSDLLGSEVRLNRYIANSGLGSRREADAMIVQGMVMVNGEVTTELGSKVHPKDVVKVSGQRIMPEKPVYILLNKPKGYITTTSDPEERRTVMDLIDLPGKERIYPVGRLDRNTTGVLLLTNDGELAQKLTHPSFEIKKVYRAKLHKKPSKEHMLAWVDGIELEDGYMAFSQIGFVDENDPSILGMEIHSGRNRIVRRMFEHFGYEIEALDRVLLGEFDKIKLGRGKWRFLSEKEVNYVQRIKRTKPKPFDPEELKPKTPELDLGDLDMDWE